MYLIHRETWRLNIFGVEGRVRWQNHFSSSPIQDGLSWPQAVVCSQLVPEQLSGSFLRQTDTHTCSWPNIPPTIISHSQTAESKVMLGHWPLDILFPAADWGWQTFSGGFPVIPHFIILFSPSFRDLRDKCLISFMFVAALWCEMELRIWCFWYSASVLPWSLCLWAWPACT